MSEDIKELVKRLRAEEWATVEREQTRNAAADALEAMAGEVERLTVAAKAADMFHAINGHGIKQAEELADHIIRQMLWGMRIDDSNKGIVRGYLLDHFKAVISRAEAAEAERDRLAGEVLGGSTREDGQGVEQLAATASHAVTAPATDPAPAVCVWTPQDEGPAHEIWETGCGTMYERAKSTGWCSKCKAPIKFTEAK